MDGDSFTDLTTKKSGYDAIWFSDDENIAREFSQDFSSGICIVFRLNIKRVCRIANFMDYNLALDIKDKYGLDDFRDIIPILLNMGYNGWRTTGSIGYNIYDDYCVFHDDIIEVTDFSYSVKEDDWSDYIPINELDETLETIENTDS